MREKPKNITGRTKFKSLASTVALVIFLFTPMQRACAADPEPFRIPDPRPTDYEDIAKVLGWEPGGGADEVIPDDLDQAMCGGWDMDDNVDDKIARTDGIPGHKIEGDDPLGRTELGMAPRDDAFDFPGDSADTCGFFTACVPGDWPGPQPPRSRTHPEMNVPDGHFCQRPLDGYRSDTDDSGNKIHPPPGYLEGRGLKHSCGNASMAGAQGNFCGSLNGAGVNGGICQNLNEWQYTIYQRPIRKNVFIRDVDGNKIPLPTGGFATTNQQVGWHRRKGSCMSYRPGKDETPRADEISNQASDGFSPFSTRYCCTDAAVGDTDNANCIPCNGQECADGKPITTIASDEWRYCWEWDYEGAPVGCTTTEPLNGAGSSEYVSYFRHYIGQYTRSPVAKVPDDDHERLNVPVSCYGLWWDFDPKEFIVPKRYWRCVIGIYYRGGPYADKFFVSNSRRDTREKNRGKGDYKLDPPKDDPAVDDGIRKFYTENSGYEDFDDEKHFWFLENSDTISYFNKKAKVSALQPDTELDISFAVLNLDNARARSAVQQDLDMPLSESSLVLAFDDSANNINFRNVFVNWWQMIQSKAHKLEGPKARIVLPSPADLDLNPNMQLISPKRFNPNTTEILKNPKQQPVEVVLEVREDLLGDVQEFLEKAVLIPHRQELIPVVVPAGAAIDYRARAHGWCKWWQQQENSDGVTCDDGPAADLIDKLEEYADRIDEARKLRGELDEYAGKYLEMHKETTEKIIEWMETNFSDFDAYLANLDEFKERKEQWEDIAEIYQNFEDEINMPWCRNDRFTLPVYSFLDPWWPRPDGYTDDPPVPQEMLDSVIPEEERVWDVDPVTGKPDLFPDLTVDGIEDIVIDLSNLERTSTGVVLPVVKPIEIAIDWSELAPPAGDIDSSEIPDLPDLPPIPSFKNDIISNLPPVTTPGAIPATVSSFATPFDTSTLEDELETIEAIIQGMHDSYKIFWDMMTIDPHAGRINFKSEEDCYYVGLLPGFHNRCGHVEADLIERFTRLGSRPAVFLKEDIETRAGQFRDPTEEGYQTCNNKSWTCQLLNQQYSYPKESWKISAPYEEQEDQLKDYRETGYEDTLRRTGDAPEDLFPYIVPGNRIVPSFATPTLIPIYPIPNEDPPTD